MYFYLFEVLYICIYFMSFMRDHVVEKPIGYNSFLVYCRELAPGIVGLTGDRAQGDDSKHD